MSAVTCPKCQGQMRQYERSGIVVDQCGECRGIFLDRGELDHLITAESQWSGNPAGPGYASPAAPPPRYEDHRYEQHYDDDRRYEQRPYGDKYRHKKKRRSFFEDLFDD
ncbi:zf-TFIIB domain-containing protein [Actinoallomurus sp. NBC_01490]|uniref:TFIIB-type zinc ribbon-containing protein n=1 Tax=Actinoallomurus sp. NBC_01490 TaxID=2903557 RepID=UPI002E373136|nr:zf-TFIIB domain-containing protein [Actinoallomurus sp. NBC_01490]